MTILPKKTSQRPPGGGGGATAEGSQEHQHPQGGHFNISSQAAEAHERLFVSAGGGSDDIRWSGSPRPGQSSPPRWPHQPAVPAVSREEKRHLPASPIHPADYDDSMDGAPSSKRVRFKPSVGVSAARARGASLVPATTASCSRVASPARGEEEEEEEEALHEGEEGYNSEDEYSHVGQTLTEAEWREKDLRFERVMRRKGYIIKPMGEDGACLFRAVADQLYGDQEMHPCVRAQCMDYIQGNSDHYAQFVSEPIEIYVERKRALTVHGNHLEIQALSEMYGRPIHIYCYSQEPINIFQHIQNRPGVESELNIPIRLCYHRGVHYNSLTDPNNVNLGVGLGLPGLKPGIESKALVANALINRDNILTEQQMMEDKIKATDWEATNEAIEEQVARESYLQWLAEQEKQKKNSKNPPAATVTSGQVSPRGGSSSPRGGSSPRNAAQQQPLTSPRPRSVSGGQTSPKAGCSSQPDAVQGRDSPKPGGSRDQGRREVGATSAVGGFHLQQTASFLNGLPPDFYGLEDWNEDAMLSQVLAASQQEYIDSFKGSAKEEGEGGSNSQ